MILAFSQVAFFGFAVITLAIAGLSWKQKGFRAAVRPLLLGLPALAVAVALTIVWNHRWDAFLELRPRLAHRLGACPTSLDDPDIAPVAARVPIEIDQRGQRIVWSGFSLRRAEVYDCTTGDFSVH